MTIRFRHIIALCGLAMLPVLSGCKDPVAEARSADFQKIQKASETLARQAGTVLPGTEEFDARQQTLQSVRRELASVKTRSSGKSMLLATINSELADLSLAKAEMIEHQLHGVRLEVAARIRASQQLASTVAGSASVNLGNAESELSTRREQANDRLRAFSRQLSDLNGPIADLQSQNRNDRQEVDLLAQRANNLRSAASELGDADGHDSFLEAVQLERRLDLIERDIAHREIDLSEHAPEQNLAQTRVDAARAEIDATDSATRGLDSFTNTIADHASEARSQINALQSEIRSQLEAIDAAIAEDSADGLISHYTEALELLEQAASAAGQARGTASAARALARRGEIYLQMNDGLREHAALLAALADDDSSARDRLETINGRISKSLANATEAFNQAREEAINAASNNPGLTRAINAALVTLGEAPTEGAASKRTTSAASSAPADEPGAEMPNGMPGMPDSK